MVTYVHKAQAGNKFYAAPRDGEDVSKAMGGCTGVFISGKRCESWKVRKGSCRSGDLLQTEVKKDVQYSFLETGYWCVQ